MIMINRNKISEHLQRAYDRKLFGKNLLKPIFNTFQLFEIPIRQEIGLTKNEEKVIDNVFIYGTIELKDFSNVSCYEILLKPSIQLEHNKVTIQQYIRKLLPSGDAAIINFVSPTNSEIWRFTLVAKNMIVTEKSFKETATNAKRYTYIVETGENKHNRTLAERLEKLSNLSEIKLQDLIDAFSVETLSKAFFDEYKAHYNKFIDYLNNSNFFTSVFNTNDKTVRDFTKKLLGRLVFLYFVQRKGWLGASNEKYKDGNQDFLMNLFLQSGCNDSFYPVWLKTLFFDTLNNPAKNGDFKMPDGNLVKIPFLNGGLFDKDDIDNFAITIPSDLFHNDIQRELPVKRGFFDFLNAFNFTIYEDSPDDHTLAVDPEMLGHIFENLLEDNKDKGAFYTPKQIVHYMCQESLIQYLITNYELGIKNENTENQIKKLVTEKIVANELHLEMINKLLDRVKICDPAIGSGAFPVGLLAEIFSLKEIIAEGLNIDFNRAGTKENIIQNSIYGVDIEKGAVDIARLRFWLSLVVDEDCPKPLPNLDYKIVEGNSLVSKFEDEVLEIDWSTDTTKTGVFAQEFAVERIRLLSEISKKQREYFHSEKIDKIALALEIRNLKIPILVNQLNLMLKTKGIETVQSNAKGTALKQQTELMLQTQGWKNATKKLEKLKNQPNEKLYYFDWKLDFPEIMNEHIAKSGDSPEIFVLNKQIEALNSQIEAVNAAIENNSATKLIKIKLVTTENQIKSVETELTGIEKQIKNVIGTISFVDKNVVGEPKNIDYQISGINRKIEEINKRIAKTNAVLLPKSNGWVGFDIVIGNPPYIAFQRMTLESKNGLQNLNYKTFENTGDIYTLFYERGHQLLKEKGVLTFITSRQWLQAAYGKSLRKYLATQTNPIQLIDFGQCKLFKEATVFVNILLTQKNTNQNNLSACLIPVGFDVEKELVSTYYDKGKQIIQSLSENTWAISNLEQINHQIFKNSKPLKDWKEIEFFRGITSGLNDAFHIQKKVKDDLINFDKKNGAIIKQLLRGKDIKRYGYEFGDWFIINTHNGVREIGLPRIDVVKDYPKIYEHLQRWQKELEERQDKGEHWTNLRNCAFLMEFEKPKIVWIEISDRANYTFDDNGMYLTNSAYFLTCKSDKYNLKYILAILNSKVADFIFSQKTARIAGGRMRYTKQFVEQIPIPELSLSEQQPFIKLADFVLYLKEQKLTDSTDKIMSFYFEHIIDLAVYELFFKEDVKKAGYDIISKINKLPEINSKSKLEEIRNIYKELNNASHPIRNAVSLLKKHEPFKTIEETLNRKDQ